MAYQNVPQDPHRKELYGLDLIDALTVNAAELQYGDTFEMHIATLDPHLVVHIPMQEWNQLLDYARKGMTL